MKLLTIKLEDEIYDYVKMVAKSQQVTMDTVLLSALTFVTVMTKIPVEQQNAIKDIIEEWT